MTGDHRSEVIEYLRRQLIGPAEGASEVIWDRPDQRYAIGVLYPVEAAQEASVEAQIIDEGSEAFEDSLADDPVSLANQWMPSAVGVSFYVADGVSVECRVAAAVYEETRDDHGARWVRRSLASKEAPEIRTLGWASGDAREVLVLEGRAVLHLVPRPLGDGTLVTVTLANALTSDRDRPAAGDCLFQVSLECAARPGSIAEYPRTEFLTADPEEEELFLTYRHRRVYAIGHGCAASWAVDGGACTSVAVDLLPVEAVPGVVVGGDAENDVLELAFLANPASKLGPRLDRFIAGYAEWVGDERDRVDYPANLSLARDRIVGRLDAALGRMRAGAALLEHDPIARRAFELANLAMLIQMQRTAQIERGEARDNLDVSRYFALSGYRWYPFQLAFALTVLPSLRNEDDRDRDLVDLLWFPTGGGKTEAYLLLAAFVIFLRRLERGAKGEGTAVITRYTLRLLTTQQFQRSAALACAMEWLRQQSTESLGESPIRLGLWVGGEAFPNKFVEARDWLRDVLDGSRDEALPLPACPWCGTPLLPPLALDEPDAVGVEATNGSFRVFCPRVECDFHADLPVAIVDEDMYASPPAMVIGTVDKFARLAWAEGGGAFFGLGRTAPPSLVIQDEMHLISGPLGTTVGVYEAAIGGLLELGGARPKVVASTATIRRADDQAMGVFGRRVALFPPSGLDEENSYFARRGEVADGRLYVGAMSANHTPSSALIHAAAALAQSPVSLALAGDSLDAMWTLVIYHNSLRELGKVLTFARDDIPARIHVIERDEKRRRPIPDDTVEELTSNVSSSRIPAILERMKARWNQPNALSMLLATNMIQVGIDVPRLGLMLVNGQPKTTSEYIQATSRIGRKQTPGLVLTLFSSSKPRDRSHYESFHPYHQALYRFVEPTSVTPFSLPSRNRALAAALVVLVRHGVGLRANDAATQFRGDDPAVRRVIELLLRRICEVDPLELGPARDHLERLVDEWNTKATGARCDASSLYYWEPGRSNRRLLRKYGSSGDGWDVLDSMRSVDRQVVVNVIAGAAGGG